MIRRGSNLLQKVLDEKRWIDAFPVGTVVSPVILGDDHYFTGHVVEVQPKINKVFVSWNGGSQVTQHEPDELEPIYPCNVFLPVSGSAKTASVRTASEKQASMSDYEYQCACAIRNALVEEHAAVAVYEEMAQFAQDDDMKTVAQSIAEEEKVHIGELTALLNRYNGNELETMAEGVAENEEQLCPCTTPAVEIGADIPAGPLAPVPENVVVVGIDDADGASVAEVIPTETVSDVVPVETVVEAVPAVVENVVVPESEPVKRVPPAIIPLLASASVRVASKYKDCGLCEIGKIIRENYSNMPLEAEIFVDYFDGMDDLDSRLGNYDGVDVVKGFLETSADWTSPTGKAIKSELERRVKEFEKGNHKPLLDADKKGKK